jgi:hypothetical protein
VPTIDVPGDFVPNVVNYVAVSSVTTKRALDEVEAHRQMQKRADTLRPEILKLMLGTGAIPAHQKEAADAMLSEHAGTLQLLGNALQKLAGQKTQKQAGEAGAASAEPGSAANEKSAGDGYDSLSDPFVGQRKDVMKASDRALLARHGIPH